jgi:hypothetical protein
VSLYPSIYSGLNVGLKPSTLTKYAALGPNRLANFDYSEPATVGVNGSGSFTSEYATDEWEDFSTGTVPNAATGGTETLVDSNGFTNRNTANLWNGTDFTTRVAWETNNGGDKLTASGTTAGDSNNQDIAGRVVMRINPGGVVSNDYAFAKCTATTVEGWRLYFSGGTLVPNVNIKDDLGNVITFAVAGGPYDDGAWFEIKFLYDYSADMLYLKTNRAAEGSASTAALTGTLTNSAAVKVNSREGSTRGLIGAQYAYAGVSVGANAQNFYNESVTLPGADPATQDAAKTALTTVSRGSLISVPTSATTVGHYSDDQLPVGFNSNLTSGYALYANSTVTNLLPYSESVIGWTNTWGTTTSNYGDSPDGFRSSIRLEASGAGQAFYDSGITTLASTEYTWSFMMRSTDGGADTDVTVLIRDDSNANVIVTETKTATSEWQEFSVTGTTGVGGVSCSARILALAATDDIEINFFQFNLGDARGAYIRTSGASAALVFSNYQASFADGTIKAETGEAECVYTRAFGSYGGSNCYVWDCGNATSSANRRYLNLSNTGVNPTSGGYNESSGSVWTVTSGAQSVDAEECTSVVRWDSSGGLAVAAGAEAQILYNGGSSDHDVGTFTSTETINRVSIGNYRGASSVFAMDGYVQRLRFWDGERA